MTVDMLIHLLTLVFAFLAAFGALYNAFFIQRPWFKEYNKASSRPKDFS